MGKGKDNHSNDMESFEIKLWDSEKINKKGGLWFTQLKTMLKKNIILQIRFWKSSLVISIITPLLAMALLKFLIFMKSNTLGKQVLYPEKYELSGVEDCINNQRMNFNWDTNPANWENWENDKLNYDIKEKHDIVHVPNSNFIYNYSLNHQNITNYGIVFDVLPTMVLYLMLKEKMILLIIVINSKVVSVARGIDEAIIRYSNGNPNIKAEFNIDIKDFPELGVEGYEEYTVTAAGPMIFFCVAMVIFVNILNTIVTEKESKIRYSMEMMGLKQSVYWLSWSIIYVFYFLVNAIATILFGKLFGYSFFTNTNFGVLFLVFFVYGIAMGAVAMFITTIVKSTRIAVLIGISILIIGFLINCVIFQYENLAYLFWSDTIPVFIGKCNNKNIL
ncbi:hypothetical protein PIROE2DRAFT_64203 [Piromyces sp. E2]|nr:hypothetical protein PIROE2DRAFT_64203 [Piromyces sp. E2]|eukprot:OUM58765.1 hypothetical protein PIROE2DRAFT_64203 [Piromyces sp. E2]